MGLRFEEIIPIIIYINLCLIQCSSQKLWGSQCGNTIGNYSENGKFKENLNTIINSLTSNIDEYGFLSKSAGEEGDDQVNAIALCRGDIYMERELCQKCVDEAARNLTLVNCINQKEAIIWFDKCMFRYSNQSIKGIMSDAWNYVSNTYPALDVISFAKEVILFADDLLNRIGIGSNNSGSPVKFVAGKSNNSDVNLVPTIYGYMQCTPDISSSQCVTCLNSAITHMSDCCDKSIGVQMLTPSCFFRYEIYPFLNQSLTQLASLPSSLPPSPPSSTITGKGSKSKTIIIVLCVIIAILVVTQSVCGFTKGGRWKKTNTRHKKEEEAYAYAYDDDFEGTSHYDFALIKAATNDFSTANVLGKGGFGEVYRGVLNEEEIAVKRLSITSRQGEKEFKNEIKLLAKLQHNCLVKLLGFCLRQTEKLLVYEFMANGSLDKILFDQENRSKLDWERRFRILNSIAKGLLYLHEDSRLNIIHRDLKAGNILLDKNMNAKIADFGMARLFVLDEDEVITKKVAGTLGYMAPEYAMHGLFSVKSDVYSYGVLLLEILSGKENSTFLTEDKMEDLPIYTYKTWKEGKSSDLLDTMLTANLDSKEIMIRCMHIALLCVQENIGRRPTMVDVFLMLQSSTLALPTPSQPGFFSNLGHGPTIKRHFSEVQSTNGSTDTISSSNAKKLNPRSMNTF